jgi:hypothetical protein
VRRAGIDQEVLAEFAARAIARRPAAIGHGDCSCTREPDGNRVSRAQAGG